MVSSTCPFYTFPPPLIVSSTLYLQDELSHPQPAARFFRRITGGTHDLFSQSDTLLSIAPPPPWNFLPDIHKYIEDVEASSQGNPRFKKQKDKRKSCNLKIIFWLTQTCQSPAISAPSLCCQVLPGNESNYFIFTENNLVKMQNISFQFSSLRFIFLASPHITAKWRQKKIKTLSVCWMLEAWGCWERDFFFYAMELLKIFYRLYTINYNEI